VAVETVTPPLPGCDGLTVRLAVVVREPVMPLAVPLMVTGKVPVVAVAEAVNVTVLVAPVAGLGLAVTVTPAGWPLAASVTAPVKPPVRVMVTVLVAAALGGILIPLVLARLGVDPAVSSGPFVTTITDVVGFFAFLGIATVWFGLT
jgi:Mg/Co/Ni transporter MgtE